MKVDLAQVQDIVNATVQAPDPTGDSWLDGRYAEDATWIGHANPYYRVFYRLALRLVPLFVVELGSYWGTAAAHFASGSPSGSVVTIDIHREDKYAQQKARSADAQYPNLRYLNGWTWDSHIVLQVGQEAARTPIDILYIDAWHTYEYAMREWELYSPMLSSEALVICDDIFNAQGATERMVEFWEQISTPYEHFLDKAGHCGVPMGYLRFTR